MTQPLTITRKHLEEMLSHIKRELPLEACGMLAGRDGRVERVLPVRNQSQSPVRFLMDPHEQLKAFDWIDSNGLFLLGIFHSHPAGPETVSATDIAEAAYEVVHVVCSKSGDQWNLRGFWIENGQAAEIPLLLNDE